MPRHALVIGIENYQTPQLENLTKAVADAEAIAHLLEKYCDCPRDQIRLLTKKTTKTGKVTTEDLITAFRDFLFKKRGERVIYFSGHGILEEKKHPFYNTVEQQGYLATSDCKIKQKNGKIIVEDGGLKLADLVDLIGESQVSSLIIILDACHSGSLLQEVQKKFAKFSNESEYYFIAACQSWAESWSKQSDKYSQFTQAFIEALSEEKIDENNGVITIGQAFDSVAKTMENLGSLTSNQGRQKPIFLGMGGRLELVKYHPTAQLLKSEPISQEKISQEQITNLKTILQPVERNILAWVLLENISYVALDTWLDSDETRGLDSFLTTIQEKFPQLEDRSSSLLKIIKGLVNHPQIESGTKQKIKSWLSNFLTIDLQENNSVSINPFLMLVIAQERPNEPFKLAAFLKIKNIPTIPIKIRLLSGQKPYQKISQNCYLYTSTKWEGIETWVKDVIETSENFYLKGCPNLYQLNIELFLPFNYLTKTLDLWPIKQIGGRIWKLGEQYSCIVRSWERITDGYYSNQLKQVWSRIDERTIVSQIKRLEKLQIDDYDQDDYSQLEEDLNENYICGLSCYLPEDYEMLFAILLDTGNPLIIWSRPNPCQCQFEQLLNGPITELEDLTKAVFQHRKKAHRYRKNPESKWGYYLAMLCDNPERTPPSQYLQAPRI